MKKDTFAMVAGGVVALMAMRDGGSHSVMRKKEPKDGSFFCCIKNPAYFL